MTTQVSRWRAVVASTAVAALTLTGCQAESSIITPHNPTPLVTVVSADYAEAEILAQIYGTALEHREYRVRIVPLVGDTQAALDMVESGEATFTVGFTGDLMRRYDPDETVTAPDDVYAAAMAALPEPMTAGQAAPAEDKPVYVVSQNTSETMGLTKLSDLAGNCGELALGARQEVLDDTQLSRAVGETYDCSFARRQALPTDPRLVVEALRAGTVGVGVMQSADPALEGEDLVVLEDDRDAVTAQQLVPVYRKGSLSEDQIGLVDAVSRKITTDDVRELVRGSEFGSSATIGLAVYWLDKQDFSS